MTLPNPPVPRAGMGFMYTPSGIVCIGGAGNNKHHFLGDIHLLDVEKGGQSGWMPVAFEGVGPRIVSAAWIHYPPHDSYTASSSSSSSHQDQDQSSSTPKPSICYAFGGSGGARHTHQLWAFDLQSRRWWQPKWQGTLHEGVWGMQGAALAPDRWLLFGGRSQAGRFVGETTILSLPTQTVTVSGSGSDHDNDHGIFKAMQVILTPHSLMPAPRVGHAMCAWEGTVILAGGTSPKGHALRDVYQWQESSSSSSSSSPMEGGAKKTEAAPLKGHWIALPPLPEGRRGMSLTACSVSGSGGSGGSGGGGLIAHGGMNSDGKVVNTTWYLPSGQDEWKVVEIVEGEGEKEKEDDGKGEETVPTPRFGAGLVAVPSENGRMQLYLFGGANKEGVLPDLWKLEIETVE
jgi:hypothetical protein